MTLPFGLKSKPIPYYFEHGLIRFSNREGTLHYTVKQITKENNGVVIHGVVKDKTQLERLLQVKNIMDVIQIIEGVK